MASKTPDFLVVLLHGVGSSGADLAPLGAALSRFLPDTQFVSPDAPDPSAYGAGYQWFSVVGVTPENRPERIVAARSGFDAVIEAAIVDNGFADRRERVALIGFSQGSIMALDALATGRQSPLAVVAFAGRLATPDPLAPPINAHALLIHGDSDAVIPAAETRSAAERLTAAGVTVETDIVPGIGHTIAPQSIQVAGRYLARLFDVLR
jgi:phospholipase/carboxylesterase